MPLIKNILRAMGFGTLLYPFRKSYRYIKQIQSLGFQDRKKLHQLFHCRRKGIKATSLNLKSYPHTIHFREGTSDTMVLWQIFAEREYDCLNSFKNISVIIDCGANIGCSSFYFLNKNPRAKLIAIEPDPENIYLCKRNLMPFKENVKTYEAGIWSKDTDLKIVRGEFRDGKEWSHQVRECINGETPDVTAISLQTIINQNKIDRIHLLKIDIEASEKVVFAENTDWLKRVDNIIIELHDAECERIFFKALLPYNFKLSHSGELTVCQNIKSKENADFSTTKFAKNF